MTEPDEVEHTGEPVPARTDLVKRLHVVSEMRDDVRLVRWKASAHGIEDVERLLLNAEALLESAAQDTEKRLVQQFGRTVPLT